jgi:hypothetical protein
VKLQATPSAVKAEEVYTGPKLPNAIGGAIVLDGYLYGTTGTGLMCVEFATGKVKWTDRSIGAASILAADGRFYLHGENGEAALVGATPEAYQEYGRFTPPDGPKDDKPGSDGKVGKAWAYPVVANGRLYLRDTNVLWSYDVKAK